MPRIQSITQQHFLERATQPLSSHMIAGISGAGEGVPKMHPLKSSLPALKASSMIHGLRIKKFGGGAGRTRLPKMPGFKPIAGFPRLRGV